MTHTNDENVLVVYRFLHGKNKDAGYMNCLKWILLKRLDFVNIFETLTVVVHHITNADSYANNIVETFHIKIRTKITSLNFHSNRLGGGGANRLMAPLRKR